MICCQCCKACANGLHKKNPFFNDGFAEILLLAVTRPKIPKDVIVEAENTKAKRSNGFGRIVKSSSHQNVSKARQKLPNLAAAAI